MRAAGILLTAIVVAGVVTDEGIECRAMRGDDGTLYTFGHLPDDIPVGARIRVRGAVMQDSVCQQGTTLRVEQVERIGRQE